MLMSQFVLLEIKMQVVRILKLILKDENIIKYHEKYIHTWPLHPYDALVDLIKDRKWDKLSSWT